jgi:hypothetical protein
MTAAAKQVQLTTAVVALLNTPPVAFTIGAFTAKRAYRPVSDLKDKAQGMLVSVIAGDGTGQPIDVQETEVTIPVAVVIQAKVATDTDCDQYVQLAEQIQQTLETASFAPALDAHWTGDTRPGAPNPDVLETQKVCSIVSVVSFRTRRARTFTG